MTSISLFFATLWLVVVVCIFQPNAVGEWQAQRDIAYDATFINSLEGESE